jgi:class 3 adenylate cyclase
MKAWIETSDARRIDVASNCSFGRSPTNTVQLASLGASRRHAHIHAQNADSRLEYWLADLGSTNGTLCNGKRVVIPCRLKDGDVVRIVEEEFTFKVERQTFAPFWDTESPATVPVRANRQCWLLMLDIKRYTRLATELETNLLAQKVGTWLRKCRDAVDGSGGVVDKFLGDAIFAYWPHSDGAARTVAETVRQLTALQHARDPDFRIVLHHGAATLSGGAGGADNLSGSQVIYVFRMEKVCSGLGIDTIVSAAAATALSTELPCAAVGAHPLDGFEGKHDLFKLTL